MSFGTASVDVELDAKRAVEQLQQLLRSIASSDAQVTLSVNASNIAPTVEDAVEAASSEVEVTADARQVTGAIDSSVDAADSEIQVTGDASQVTGEIDGSIDAADTDVIVTGDAEGVTGEINGAVAAADSEVIIVGDARDVTGSINGAIAAADSSVSIQVDESGLSQAADAADALDTSLLAATGQASSLRTAIAAIGFAAAAAGLFSLVDAASEAEQSVGAVSAIFGSAAGIIDAFAAGSAEAAGLTATAARNMTSQIGALLQGFGFTQQEAAKTSVVLAQLGADLAATFGGSPEDAVLALGAALRGEFDPLERFGVSLNITQANLKAVELGLADSTSNVDLNARAQASLALIMERSTGAQGQFAREINTTAGQLAVAKASAQEAAVAVGETLAPTFVELLGIVTDQVLPALEDLGTTLGPALASAVSAAAPVFGSLTAILVSLTPVIEALAAIIQAIPAPVLQAAATFLTLRTALGPLGSLVNLAIRSFSGLSVAAALNVSSMGLFRGSVATARDGVSALASSISPLTAALTLAAVAFTLYAQQQANAKREAAEMEAQADSLREALESQEGAVEGLSGLFEDLANKGKDLQLQFLNLEVPADRVFQDAGISAQEFAEGLADTDEPINRLIDSLREGSNTMQSFDADTKELAAQSLAELQLQATEVAGQMILAGIATERWSEAQVRAAFAANTTADGSVQLVGALNDLTEQERATEEAAQAQADAITEQEKALQELATTAPQVTFLMTALGTESGRTTDLLGAFAIAASNAGLSEQEMQVALSQLGAAGPQAVADLQAVADTIARVRDAGVNALPSIEDLAGEFDEFSLKGFRDDLAKGLEAIQNFNNNLVLIAQDGGPRLAAAAAQLGPQFAAEIADGIKNGSPGVAQQVELLLAAVEGAGTDTSNILQNQIGPDLAVATGQMGTLASSAFGANFRLDPSGQIVQLESSLIGGRPGVAFRAMELGTGGTGGFDSGLDFSTPATSAVSDLDNTIADSGPGVRNRAEELGSTATSGFQSGFTPSRPASTRVDEARVNIQNAKEGIRRAGSSTGSAGTLGFGSGVAGMGEAGRVATVQAINTILRLRGLASSGGRQVGASLGQGIVSGLVSQSNSVQAAATSVVEAAIRAAKIAAKTGSPSKVFMDIGEDMGTGVAIGMTNTAGSVVKASADLVAQAAAAAAEQEISFASRPTLRPLAVAPDAQASVQSAVAAAIGGTSILFAEGAFQIVFQSVPDQAEAQTVGNIIGNSVADTLNRRLVRVAARSA